jgi:hypothetical protein
MKIVIMMHCRLGLISLIEIVKLRKKKSVLSV